MLRLPVALALLLGLTGGAAAEDATPEQAGNSLLIRGAMVSGIIERCGVAYPSRKDKLERDLATWRQRNADTLAAAEKRIAELPDPNRKTLTGLIEQSHAQGSALLDAAIKANAGEDFCAEAIANYGANTATGRLDASSYDGAVGMYSVKMWTQEVRAARCIEQAPETRVEIERDNAEWERRDATIRSNVLARLEVLEKDNSEALQAFREVARKSASEALDKVQQLGPEAFAKICRDSFADLARGTNRNETPKLYQFLESAPPRPATPNSKQ